MTATVNLAYAQHSNSTMPATRGTSSKNCCHGTPHLELSTNFCSFTGLMGLQVRFTRTLAGLHMSVLASRSSSQNSVGCLPVPSSPQYSICSVLYLLRLLSFASHTPFALSFPSMCFTGQFLSNSFFQKFY